MADLDPQVQIKLIELASKLAKDSVASGVNAKSNVTAEIKQFSEYYKTLLETVSK